MPTSSEPEADSVVAPVTVEPLDGAVTDTAGGVVSGGGGGGVPVFETVTMTADEVATLPTVSRACAVSVCGPLATVVVSHEIVKGALRSSSPRLTPSNLNCTPPTATLSMLLAKICVVPDTVAKFAGAYTTTDGADVSAAGGGGS